MDKISVTELMSSVQHDVMLERIRQNKKWGIQRHHLGVWLAILTEEVGEAAQAMQSKMGLSSNKPTDAIDLYNELIQVAAVASAMAEQVKEGEMAGG